MIVRIKPKGVKRNLNALTTSSTITPSPKYAKPIIRKVYAKIWDIISPIQNGILNKILRGSIKIKNSMSGKGGVAMETEMINNIATTQSRGLFRGSIRNISANVPSMSISLST